MNEPTESTDASEPADPIDKIEPAEPIDRIEPADPMDKMEPVEPMLRSDPVLPVSRRTRSPLLMRPLSQQADQPGCSAQQVHPAGELIQFGRKRPPPLPGVGRVEMRVAEHLHRA